MSDGRDPEKLAALTSAASLGADAARQATTQVSTAYALSMLSIVIDDPNARANSNEGRGDTDSASGSHWEAQ